MLLFTFSGISKIHMTIRSDVELLDVEASYPVATSNSCKIHLPLPNLSTPLATELFLTKRSVGRGRNTKRRKGEWRMKGCRTVVVPVSWTIEENADCILLFRSLAEPLYRSFLSEPFITLRMRLKEQIHLSIPSNSENRKSNISLQTFWCIQTGPFTAH